MWITEDREGKSQVSLMSAAGCSFALFISIFITNQR